MSRVFATECPKCGAKENLNLKTMPDGSPIGCRLRTCKKCGAEYVEKRIVEAASMPKEYYKDHAKKAGNKTPAYLICVAGAVFMALVKNYIANPMFQVIGIMVGAFIFGLGIERYKKCDKARELDSPEFWEAYARSAERLEDPEYQAKMQENGIKMK